MKMLTLITGCMLCALTATAQTVPEPVPQAVKDLFGKNLINAQKKEVSVDTLKGKIIGVYFSSHACGPCRIFTPKLVEFYNTLAEKKEPFEVVLISGDKTEEDMLSYMTETKMPWLAIPHDSDAVQKLQRKFKVRIMPVLAVIDAEGNLISANGYGEVKDDGTAAFDTWRKKATDK